MVLQRCLGQSRGGRSVPGCEADEGRGVLGQPLAFLSRSLLPSSVDVQTPLLPCLPTALAAPPAPPAQLQCPHPGLSGSVAQWPVHWLPPACWELPGTPQQQSLPGGCLPSCGSAMCLVKRVKSAVACREGELLPLCQPWDGWRCLLLMQPLSPTVLQLMDRYAAAPWPAAL